MRTRRITTEEMCFGYGYLYIITCPKPCCQAIFPMQTKIAAQNPGML